jgi:hypothetical protein
MNARSVLCGLLILGLDAAAAACDLPRLVAIPVAADVGQNTPALIVAMQDYVAGIRDYVTCVKDELAAAGGDAAPPSLRNVLILRNNAAVAEAEAAVALFAARVAPIGELYLAEFVTGAGADCVQTPRLESTAVVDDHAVLFIERAGRTYLNVLEAGCPDLERLGKFEVHRDIVGRTDAALGPVRTNRLCSSEFIYPYAFETSSTPRRECSLGQFFELTAEQAARIMELRPAARQAAAAEPGD